jgi:hypothetical protein
VSTRIFGLPNESKIHQIAKSKRDDDGGEFRNQIKKMEICCEPKNQSEAHQIAR